MKNSSTPWVSNLEQLVSFVEPGVRISAGGVHYTRIPVAALLALGKSGVGDLHYVAWGGGLALEILLEYDAVGEVEICFSNADVFGLAPRFRRAAEAEAIPVRDRTALQLITGLRAAAEHLEWAPMQSPDGSVFADPELRLPTEPPTQRVEAIPIDVLILHAQRADDAGNVEIEGARATDVASVFAARKVLVTVEERVPEGTLNARSAIVIPRDRVTAIALEKNGAHPTSCLPLYGADISAFGRAMMAPDSEQMIRELTRAPRDTVALPKIPSDEISQEICAAGESDPGAPWTVDELLVCWLSRSVDNSSICSCGSSSLISVAAYLLAKRTHAPRASIMTMNGCYVDVKFRPLTLGLAEYQDYLTATLHCGGEDSYHQYYQQGRITHEAVGAAQIDAYGRTNNLWLEKPSGGRLRLPGQGGMADVANLHSTFLIYLPRHTRLTTTESVLLSSASRAWTDESEESRHGYPRGRMAVLTDLCVMEPTGEAGRLQVTSLHPGVTLEEVISSTGFVIGVAPNCEQTVAPSAEELRILRTEVDPLGLRRLEMTPAKERGFLLETLLKVEADITRRLTQPRDIPPQRKE